MEAQSSWHGPALGLVWSPELELSYLAQPQLGNQHGRWPLAWNGDHSSLLALKVSWMYHGSLERQVQWQRPLNGSRVKLKTRVMG